MVAAQKQNIVLDGKTIDSTTNSRRRDAMLELSQRDVSPYFSKAKDNSMQNRLRDIAQGIKAKAADMDSARKTKSEATTIAGGGHGSSSRYSGNEADHDSGYATCRQE